MKVEPTETVNGFTLHECACGYSYESDPVASLGSSAASDGPSTSDVKVYDYIYNGSSLTQLTITTTTYGSSPVIETLYFGNGTVTYNGTVYYYVTNLQGDVVAILDDEGTAVVEYTYDAWGNILTTTGSMATTLGAGNPLTYRGYVYDEDTSLYYLQSRYYNPEVGRFINADALVSTGQGFVGNNMFAYCLNQPVILADFNGGTARISFGDNPDILDMPWEGAGGGGGLNTSAGAYLIILRMKYSENEDIRDAYSVLIDAILVDDWQGVKDLVKRANNNKIIAEGSTAVKIGKGIWDIVNGVKYILAPIPTKYDEIKGIRLIQFGIYSVIYNIIQLFVGGG